jgi:ribonuclease P protein component
VPEAAGGNAMPSGLVRLKTRADFLRVAASGRRAVRPGLLLQAAARPPVTLGAAEGAVVRIGFTASRKVGNAVVRNRAKRRLRAAADELLARDGRPGTDYVLIARAGTGERRPADLLADLASALRQVGRQTERNDPARPGPRAGRRSGRAGSGEARPERVEED